ncbi:hypothetical protein SAMN05444145_10249 [Alistipes timonensis JC136]|uniref:Uncharacterized protein n=1 Tax=Alistipes timonensis JC136 TaxID=1033731 RepID=A0A1H3Z1U0_9BACT|nr:hypothetical protein [Alistipes timonensis]SEA17294.1 hypothetical protein SAMN05444145_10249 [Alistipes timonensis JC136]
MKKAIILRTVILVAILSILIPIGLNYILNQETPCKITVVGEGKDWLSFYGSYIGGVLTSLISFTILLFTINHNKNSQQIILQEQSLSQLKHDLATRISQLNFSRIGIVSLVLIDTERCKEENLKLDDFHQELTREFNAFNLVYENSRDHHISTFMRAYTLCVQQLFEDITTMTELIAKLPAHVPTIQAKAMQEAIEIYDLTYRGIMAPNPPEEQRMRIAEYRYKLKSIPLREKIIQDINTLINNLNSHKNNFTNPVFTAAQEWINAEQEKLNNLRA